MSVEAVIFDLDGLLIATEPVWRQVQVEVLGGLGVPLNEDMCALTMGKRIDEVVAHWSAAYPWAGSDDAEKINAIVERIVDGVVDRVRNGVDPLPGAVCAVRLAKEHVGKVAVASSSHLRLIEAAVESLGLDAVFDVICSAQHELLGKPHPAVYLSAANALAVPAKTCLAIEDSVPGAIAAKAANMRCIAVPEGYEGAGPPPVRFAFADHVLPSLEHLSPTHFGD